MKRSLFLLIALSSWLMPLSVNGQLPPWLHDLAGTWVEMGSPRAPELAPTPVLEIRPEWISAREVRLVATDYCASGEADFLLFAVEPESRTLTYVGAERDGQDVGVPRLMRMELRLDPRSDAPRLHYMVEEIDASYLADFWLHPMPSDLPTGGWACGPQLPFTALLSSGDFALYNADRQALTLRQAFGTGMIAEELQFLARHPNLLPMYETWCATSAFDIVVVGGVYPGSEVQVYAIEWEETEIRLYETSLPADSHELQKGNLRFQLIPERIQ